MRYLLDTNVISELRKGLRCNSSVSAWEQAELIPHGALVSVITIGEIRKGIDLIAHRDSQQAAGLESWLRGLHQSFANRILPVTTEIAEEWGRLNAVRPLPAVDSLLAATASIHGLILATRNTGDLQGLGLQMVNPFEFQPA
jgi:predicted nucleic acid-binding protein